MNDEHYEIESIIREIAVRLKELVTEGTLEGKTILIYGLDTYSLGIQSILLHHGLSAEGYICDDERARTKAERSMKGFSSRYLSSKRDLLGVWSVDERLSDQNDDTVTLIASKNTRELTERLIKKGYTENKHFFVLYDWDEDRFADSVKGKQSLSLEDIHTVLKDMLRIVDNYCLGNGMRYWVCGGTLLGTIRHKGFIPWDDDIDIFMRWDDYKRILEQFPESERYRTMGMTKTPRDICYLPFGKILDATTIVREDAGIIRTIHPVSLDIFPLVGLPSDSGERKAFFADYKELISSIWEDYYANDGDLAAYARAYDRQISYFEKYDPDETGCIGVLGTAYGEKDHTNVSVYDETLRMPFEDIEVNVPGGYKEYLDNLYGKGWMELPSEAERASHHHMEAYWV